jgi:hypothetical protein
MDWGMDGRRDYSISYRQQAETQNMGEEIES